MKRISFIAISGVLLLSAAAASAAYPFQGPASQPPDGNAPGVIWNVDGTAITQPTAKINIGGQATVGSVYTNTNINTIYKDIYIEPGRSFHVENGAAATTYNIGNWGSGQQPFTFGVYGDVKLYSFGGAVGQKGRMDAVEYCINGSSCITSWPTAGGGGTLTGITAGTGVTVSGGAPSPTVNVTDLYVNTDGDTMSGSLTMNWPGYRALTVNGGNGGSGAVYGNNTMANGYGGEFYGAYGVYATTPNNSNGYYAGYFDGYSGGINAIGHKSAGVGVLGQNSGAGSYGVEGYASAGYGGLFMDSTYWAYVGGQGYGIYTNGLLYTTGGGYVGGALTVNNGDLTINNSRNLCLGGVCKNAWPVSSGGTISSITNGGGLTVTNGGGPATTLSVIDNYVNTTGDSMSGQLLLTTSNASNQGALYAESTAAGTYAGCGSAPAACGVKSKGRETGTYGEGRIGVTGYGNDYGATGRPVYGGCFNRSTVTNDVCLAGPNYAIEANGNVHISSGKTLCLGADCRSSWPSSGAGTISSISNGGGLTVTNGSGPATTLAVIDSYVNTTGDTMSGALTVNSSVQTNGASNGYYFKDRSTTLNWALYSYADEARLWNSTYGDVYNFHNNGVFFAASDIVTNNNIYTSNGNIGGRVTSPAYPLDIAGTANLNSGITSGVALRVNGAEALWYNGTYFSYGYGGTANYFADNVGINTTAPGQRLDINLGYGRVSSGYSWLTNSDVRYKKNIVTLENTLDKVSRLRGVRFDLKEDNQCVTGKPKHIGFIAQELEKEYPELVITDDKGYKSVAYDKMTAVLTQATKELKEENDKLKSQNESLEWRLRALEAKVDTLVK